MSNKSCCKPKNKKTVKGGPDKFIISIILVTLLLLGGVVYFGTKLGSSTEVLADSQVAISVEQTTHDWGTIDIDSGIASQSFTIENQGSTPLKLYEVQTSCMCTTAQLKTGTQESKKFGMHEKSTSVFEVSPGASAQLLVEFDPAYHGPSGVGPINRTVIIKTNDPNNPTLTFQLAANVVKK